MNVSSRPFKFGCSALLLGALSINAAAAPTLSPSVIAQNKKVTDRLTWLLNKRVKKPNGEKINIVVVPTDRAGEGYFAEVRMNGAPAQLKKQLRVSEFAIDAKNVKLDVPSLWNGNKVRTEKAQTTLHAVVTEDDLTDMLAHGKSTKSMNLRVKYLGDKLQVTGNLDYMLLNGPIIGVGKLRMGPSHTVYLDILSLKLRGVEVPAFVKSQFSNKLNPIINYQDLPFNPPFKGVKVVGNKAYIST